MVLQVWSRCTIGGGGSVACAREAVFCLRPCTVSRGPVAVLHHGPVLAHLVAAALDVAHPGGHSHRGKTAPALHGVRPDRPLKSWHAGEDPADGAPRLWRQPNTPVEDVR
ncbi:hypothetical protein GCM10010278_82760 [Streptomyces melanogenes]|nr:hypothetical protein GCM10010278_82760 [Streptomyces melanogenes]